MVFDAHDRAFAFFKGACTRGIYDNMKTAVETIFVGKERAYNRRFLQMCSHYLVEPVACTPASGWEKGQVENQVGLVRERFFTPRLRVKSYDELNAWLLDHCIAYAKAHRHPEFRDRTVWRGVRGGAAEPGALCRAASTASMPCRPRCPRPAWSASTTTSTRSRRARSAARSRSAPMPIGSCSARTAGSSASIARSLRPRPDDLRSLALRAGAGPQAGALRNGAPFKDWVLPAALERVRRKLAGADDGDRQMVDDPHRRADRRAAGGRGGLRRRRCARASTRADVILNILARRREPAAADHHHDPGRAAAAARAGRRLRPLRQPQEGRVMERSEILDRPWAS